MNIEIITPQLKDQVLGYLCKYCIPDRSATHSTKFIIDSLSCSFDTFNACMQQFRRMKLISDLNLRQDYCDFILLSESHDIMRRGGFVCQEEILLTNLNKLLSEVEILRKELEPNKLDTANKVAGIASALSAAIGLFIK